MTEMQKSLGKTSMRCHLTCSNPTKVLSFCLLLALLPLVFNALAMFLRAVIYRMKEFEISISVDKVRVTSPGCQYN